DGKPYGPVYADQNGHWELVINPALAEGGHIVTVKATDIAGNVSESAGTTITIKTDKPVTPEQPTVPGGNGAATNDTTPTFSGTAEPGTKIEVVIDGKPYGPVYADQNGHWEITLSEELGEGDHTVTVKATDIAGNVSESAGTTITIKTDKPVTPEPPTVPGGNGSATNTTTPTFSGEAEPGTKIEIVIDGKPYGPVYADQNGHWELVINPALTDGGHIVTVKATDIAGNVSESAETTITVKTDKPVTPEPPTVPGGNGSATNDTTPTFSGTAEPGTKIEVVIDGKPYGPVYADQNGHWEITLSEELGEGDHAVTVKATDIAGNVSESAGTTITIKTDKPVTPEPPTVPGGNGSATNTTTPTFSGEAEPGTRIEIVIDGKPYGPVYADQNGKWELVINPALTEGGHSVTVKATDIAGNVSESAEVTITIKTDKPVTPNEPVVPGGTGVTSDPSAPISGKGTPGTTIEIYVGGQKVGDAPVDADGNWSFSFNPALPAGSNQVTTVVVDEAGNKSTPSAPVSITVIAQKMATVLTIDQVAAKTYGDADFSVTIHSNNDQSPVTYTSSNLEVVTVGENGTIHIVGAGTATITVSQAESSGFTAASAARELVVNKAKQIIQYSTVPVLQRYGTAFNMNASVSSGLPVQVTSSNPMVVKINADKLEPQGIGRATISLSVAGTNNLEPATVEVDVNVVDETGQKLIVNKLVTPNGDGVNDVLQIEGLSNLTDYHIVIVNRAGTKVFESTSYATGDVFQQNGKGFTATFLKRNNLPQGSYFYRINYKDGNTQKYKTGYIVVKY
ncbi:Ig-like domain-containing protein, partial [Pararcticibacter amylolyticus]